jgi:hypothetical protein
MTTRPEKLAAVPEGGLDTNKTVEISIQVNGTTHKEKERPKKRPSSLNPKISTTNTMDDDSYGNTATTSVGTSATTSTAGDSTGGTSTDGASPTSGNNKKAGAKVCTIPPSSATNNQFLNAAGPFLPRDASSPNDVGGGAGNKPRLLKRWTAEEEKKLASAVETFGATSWANIAANVPGRNEGQCCEKWRRMSQKAAATASGAWTVEEEKKLASAVETFGTNSWANIAANVPGRNEIQCSKKWQNMSKKAAATASGTWTVEEGKQLVSAVETFGATSWANVAANVPGRSETQCSNKWRTMSQKAAATASGAWTVEEEKKLASAVETFGATSWANIAANVPGRNDRQCSNKWQRMSKKVAATASGTWTVEEEMKLAYAVETYYGGNWAEIAKMFPGRNESQCHQQWLRVSEETAGAEPPKKRRRIDWV